MTAFTGKRTDNENSPARSYAQATANRFEALSDEEDTEDVTMEEVSSGSSGDSSNTTPKQVNATPAGTKDAESLKKSANPLSKRSQWKAAQEKKINWCSFPVPPRQL